MGFGLHRLEIYHSSVQRQTGPVHSLHMFNAVVNRRTRSDGDPVLAGTEIPERGQMGGVCRVCGVCVCVCVCVEVGCVWGGGEGAGEL